MNRNGFWTFVFSLIPGAGEMYLGLMRRGTSIMILFWGVVALSVLFRAEFLICVLPIIWAYSFFDVLNLKRKEPEELAAIQDGFVFDMDGTLNKDWHVVLKKRHGLIGTGLIILGVYALFSIVCRPILSALDLPYQIWAVINDIPSLLVAIAVIVLGVFLVRGGKNHTEQANLPGPGEDYQEFRGEQND